jgi:integrase
MNGHIRKRARSDGTVSYQARYPRKARPGKRQGDEVKTFRSKRAASDWLAERRVQERRDPDYDSSRAKTPFTDLVEAWKRVTYARLAPSSRTRYEQVLNTHLLPEFEDAQVGEITREVVRDYLAALTNEMKTVKAADGTESVESRYRTGTVLKVRTTLSAIFSEAVERGMVTANPCHGIRGLPKTAARRMLFLTAAEVAAVAEAIDARYRTLIYTAAYTGLRAGELHALRTKDVDLMRGRITVNRALKEWRGGHPVFGRPKSGEPRTVELAGELVQILGAHLSSPGGNPDRLLFTAPTGGAIRHEAWARRFYRPAVKKALPRYAPPAEQTLRFHDLRHTYVSFLIAEGVHPKAIQEQAGHKSITTTLDRYGHLLPNAGEQIKAALSNTFTAGREAGTVTPLHAAG